MGTTSPSNIIYPDGSSNFNYVTDMAAMAQSIQNALTKQGNMFSGTDSERIAYTTEAKNGTLWSNSDGDMKTYQFRAGKWFPEYEFVPLEQNGSTNGNFEPDPDQPVGVHVTNFGRMATLSGAQIQKTIFDWDANSVWTPGIIPLRVAPAGNLNEANTVWSRQDNKIISMSTEVRGFVTTPSMAGRIRLVPRERFRELTSYRGVRIEYPGITWAIPQPSV